MKAVVYKGPKQVAVETVEDPRIEQPTDVILRITSGALCGSDLHMYDGRTSADPGLVLGHEPLGIVEEVGSAVTSVKKGDRVFVPAHICCGFCQNCVRGYTASIRSLRIPRLRHRHQQHGSLTRTALQLHISPNKFQALLHTQQTVSDLAPGMSILERGGIEAAPVVAQTKGSC